MDKAVLRKWLKAGVVDTGQLKATEAGTPQGGIIFPTLVNMALDGLEKLLADNLGSKGSKPARKHKVNMVRYADDFVITGGSRELLEEREAAGREVPRGTRAPALTGQDESHAH